MQISDEYVKKFQELYKKEFGIELTKGVAYEKFLKLVQLVALVCKPMSKEEFQLVKDRRKAMGIDETLHKRS